MLDYATQKQILDPILRNPKNHVCADCDTISPTWASLDFGVFLCSNCSGAHRSLGPTITRVRSANLDKWQNEWVANMIIGNQQINKYWESDPTAFIRKPKIGATLNQIGRYVFEKYVKKKYVKDPSAADPLTSLKNGTYSISKTDAPVERQQKSGKKKITENKKQVRAFSPAQVPKAKVEVSLLEFDFDVASPQQAHVPQMEKKQIEHEDDQFSDFTQAGSTANNDKTNKDDLISFDTLLNQQKQPPQTVGHSYSSYNDLKVQNQNFHHPFNPMIAQHNLVYNAQFHPQQQYHQYHQYPQIGTHNYTYNTPNVGYPNQVGVGNYWK